MTKDEVRKYLSEIGKLGGAAQVKKHGKRKMKAWGKLGGRPKGTGKKKRRK